MVTRADFERSLKGSLAFWTAPRVVNQEGGYNAWYDAELNPMEPAPADPLGFDSGRTFIVHLRVLWDHAKAVALCTDPIERERLLRQYEHGFNFIENFRDPATGLFRHSIKDDLTPHDPKIIGTNQIYLIYVAAESALLTGDKRAAELAMDTFHRFDKAMHDPIYGGYYERTNREKPSDFEKSPGAMIHIALGYASLYRACPEPIVRERLSEMIDILISDNMLYIPGNNAAVTLTFDHFPILRNAVTPGEYTDYGHSAELVWYTLEAAEALGMPPEDFVPWAEKVAEPILKYGIEPCGKVISGGPLVGHRKGVYNAPIWWSHVEMLNFLIKMYELTGKEVYKETFDRVAEYGFKTLVIYPNGEWASRVFLDTGEVVAFGGKGWKAGLHTIRSMEYVINALDRIAQKQN